MDASSPACSLELRQLSCDRGGRLTVDHVDFERTASGVVGLVGHNGSGKTSLLRIVSQLLRATGGSVTVCGRDITDADDALARRLVGYAPHEPLLYGDLDAAANLTYAARLGGLDRAAAGAAAGLAMERWSLGAVVGQPTATLSRGWQQRCSLARADVLSPPVLLLDEPTVALDEDGIALLVERITDARATRLVVIATHERPWIDGLADELLELGTVERAPAGALS